MLKNKTNHTIEFIKLIASYMVIFIHVLWYSDSVIANSLARFAVPFFFATSGFFSDNASLDSIKRRIRNIIFLTIISFCLHTCWNMIKLTIDPGAMPIGEYFAQYISIEALKNFLLYNVTISTGSAWYLFAMIYVYAMFYFITKHNIDLNKIAVVAVILLTINLLCNEVISVFWSPIEHYIMRNFLFTGFPFFVFGLLLRKYSDKLKDIPDYALIVLFIAGVAETLISATCFGKRDMYCGSVLIVFALMTIAIKYPRYDAPIIPQKLYGCSTYIYIIHVIVDGIVIRLYPLFNVDRMELKLVGGLHPLLTCVLSTVFAYMLKNMSVRPVKNETAT